MKVKKEQWYVKKAEQEKKTGAKIKGGVEGYTKAEEKEIADYEKYHEGTDGYADGYTMVSNWKWATSELEADQTAGVCIVDAAKT